jgi:hypothetical protein
MSDLLSEYEEILHAPQREDVFELSGLHMKDGTYIYSTRSELMLSVEIHAERNLPFTKVELDGSRTNATEKISAVLVMTEVRFADAFGCSNRRAYLENLKSTLDRIQKETLTKRVIYGWTYTGAMPHG